MNRWCCGRLTVKRVRAIFIKYASMWQLACSYKYAYYEPLQSRVRPNNNCRFTELLPLAPLWIYDEWVNVLGNSKKGLQNIIVSAWKMCNKILSYVNFGMQYVEIDGNLRSYSRVITTCFNSIHKKLNHVSCGKVRNRKESKRIHCARKIPSKIASFWRSPQTRVIAKINTHTRIPDGLMRYAMIFWRYDKKTQQTSWKYFSVFCHLPLDVDGNSLRK